VLGVDLGTGLDAVLAPTKAAVLAATAGYGLDDEIPQAMLRAKAGHPYTFFNRSQHDLSTLQGDPDNLEKNLRDYVRAFSPNVRDIFERYKIEETILDLAAHDLLLQVLQHFAKVNLHPDAVSNEQMGHIFEELIRKFAEASNETAGEHFTPREVIALMVDLLLVGDGMSREALQKQVADLRAEDAVTFYGSVPATDVPKFTALADALLISLSDSPDLGLTVPGKLASYMAAAKPVLASMNGAGYAAVKESGGGLVSPACDRRALADNMLALYRMSNDERAALGQKAYAYYAAHYRRAELLKRLEEFTMEGK